MKIIWYFLVFISGISLAQESEKKFSLFYENDQFDLTQEHFQLIDSLKALENKSLFDIHIKGYTNSVGEENYNLELSRKRAENVKKELRDFTIISSRGLGQLDGEAANNRRVDILIHLKTDHISVDDEIVELPSTEEVQPSLITLNIPKKGDKVTLEGIMFYPDRDVIMDESIPALEKLITFLNKHPFVKFKLIGHICCGDSERRYLDLKNVRTGKNNLSEARAQSLYNYLAKNGIDKRRMRYIGMAYRYPTGKGDEFDRRVEIEITSID
ncbi:MAG: OmpA family protein [Flavobacteriaceae bacterium]